MKPAPMAPDAYARHKQRTAARQRRISTSGRDIAPLPPILRPDRRAAAAASLRTHLETYHRRLCPLEFSPAHLEALARFEAAGRFGGQFALAMPRGFGKTTLALCVILWAMLHGYRRFTVLVAATDSKARDLLKRLKRELEENDLLLADFPEVCYPIRALGRIRQAAPGQLYLGRPTDQEWTAASLVLPTIPGSPASGGKIAVAGLTGANLRGQQHLTGGKMLRPDLVLVDDPQTAKTARSPAQCEQRAAIIQNDVLGMAGDEKLAIVAAVTIIQQHDLASRLLDRSQFPDWQGTTYRALQAWPTNMELWEEYATLRAAEMRDRGTARQATLFYRQNWEAMHAGAQVTWPQRHNADQLDGLQWCMDLHFRDSSAFAAEYQNDPKPPDYAASADLDPDRLVQRCNGLPRGAYPPGTHSITCYVDVHRNLLFYAVVAWSADGGGALIDYNCYPEQRRPYYTLTDARHTLARAAGAAADLDALLNAGLAAVASKILARHWPSAAATDAAPPLRIARAGVDANWGDSTDAVYAYVAVSQWAVFPCHGKSIGAADKPMADWSDRPNELPGHHWRIVAGRRQARHLLIDTNFWKTTIAERVTLPPGSRGAITWFGKDPAAHRLLADHLSAEYPVSVSGRGRSLQVWRLHPNRDNHLWDCLCNSAAIASTLGVNFTNPRPAAILDPHNPPPDSKTATTKPPRRPRRRVTPLKT